jgi:C4-dicarboxylate transporter, DctQ subunit
MSLKWLDRLEETVIATLIATATLIIFVSVVHRYGLSNLVSVLSWAKANGHDWLASLARTSFLTLNSVRLTWAQELCIYLFVWMAKFGAAYGVRTGIHVGVDVLLNSLSGAKKKRLVLFNLLAGAVFTALVAGLGAYLVWHLAGTGQVSPDLELPMWMVYLAVPTGSALMCFRFLQAAWAVFRHDDLPPNPHDAATHEILDQAAPNDGGRR